MRPSATVQSLGPLGAEARERLHRLSLTNVLGRAHERGILTRRQLKRDAEYREWSSFHNDLARRLFSPEILDGRPFPCASQLLVLDKILMPWFGWCLAFPPPDLFGEPFLLTVGGEPGPDGWRGPIEGHIGECPPIVEAADGLRRAAPRLALSALPPDTRAVLLFVPGLLTMWWVDLVRLVVDLDARRLAPGFLEKETLLTYGPGGVGQRRRRLARALDRVHKDQEGHTSGVEDRRAEARLVALEEMHAWKPQSLGLIVHGGAFDVRPFPVRDPLDFGPAFLAERLRFVDGRLGGRFEPSVVVAEPVEKPSKDRDAEGNAPDIGERLAALKNDLPRRERQLVDRLGRGRTIAEAAADMKIARKTADAMLGRIRKKSRARI